MPENVNSEIDDFFLDYELSTLNESKIIEGATKKCTSPASYDVDEFYDAALEEAMGQLDISNIKPVQIGKTEFKEELFNLVSSEKATKKIIAPASDEVDEFYDAALEEAMGQISISCIKEEHGNKTEQQPLNASEESHTQE